MPRTPAYELAALRRQAVRQRSYGSYVLANLRANGTAPMPIPYHLA